MDGKYEIIVKHCLLVNDGGIQWSRLVLVLHNQELQHK